MNPTFKDNPQFYSARKDAFARALFAGRAFPFRAPRPEDRAMYMGYQPQTEISCRSFISQYAYAEEDGVRYFEDEKSGCLLCVCLNESGQISALTPMGAKDDARFSLAVDRLRDFFAACDLPLRFCCVEAGELARFHALPGYRFLESFRAEDDDYVCSTANLCDFSGGDNYNRRQSRNKFLRRHEVDINLNPAFDEIEYVARAWCQRRDCADCAYRCPFETARRVLLAREAVGVRAMVMRMDGEPEAMLITGDMGGDTEDLLSICNRTRTEGLTYAFLEMACKQLFPQAKYLNLEEDLGLDNLRHIKRLLRPVRMVRKYELTAQRL